MGHTATTKLRHPSLSPASSLTLDQVYPALRISFSKVRLLVCLGHLVRLYPWGIHSKLYKAISECSFQRVSSNHLHFWRLMTWLGSWLVRAHRPALEIVSGHDMPRIFCKHLMIKVCSIFVTCTVTFQASQAYRSKDLTLLFGTPSNFPRTPPRPELRECLPGLLPM